MKAIAIRQAGGPEVLEIVDLEPRALAGGDLLVRVEAAGVNYIDTYHRSGAYKVEFPFVPGMEGAGVVVEAGADVRDFAVGDRVAWGFAPGSYAELAVVPADKAVRVPDHLSLDLAAAVMLQGMTAHYLTESTFAVQAGNAVLVHAGAGGAGRLIIQAAKAKGATVIATASTPDKRDRCIAAGANHAIDYTDFAQQVRTLTGDRGVDVVYDGVGRDTFDGSLASLTTRGMLVLFGASSGPVPPFELQRLNSGGSLFITRPSLGHYLSSHAEFLWRAESVLAAVASGAWQVEVHRRYSLAEAGRAHADIENRSTSGKLLLIP